MSDVDETIGRITSDRELQLLERAVLSVVKDCRRVIDGTRSLVLFDAPDYPRTQMNRHQPAILQSLLKLRDEYLKINALAVTPKNEQYLITLKADLLNKIQKHLEGLSHLAVNQAKVAKDVLVSIALLAQRQREHKDKTALAWAELDQKGVRPLSVDELEKIAAGQPMDDATPIVIEDDPVPPMKSERILESL